MSDKRMRRHFSPQEKVAILKRHLLEKVPVSNLCDEFDLHATQIYTWLKEFFENGHAAFENGRSLLKNPVVCNARRQTAAARQRLLDGAGV
jgi:transposase-like protein